MSMISAQIDELRELAGDSSMEWVTGPIRASVLRDAADTIWELRDDLQRADAENAKLRELVAKYSAAAKYLCGHSHCNECNLDCASFFDDVPSGWDCARMLLDKRARELGIEVTT